MFRFQTILRSVAVVAAVGLAITDVAFAAFIDPVSCTCSTGDDASALIDDVDASNYLTYSQANPGGSGLGDLWETALSDTVTLTFDLGGAYDVTTLYGWRYNRTDLSFRGINEYKIYGSTDGVDYNLIANVNADPARWMYTSTATETVQTRELADAASIITVYPENALGVTHIMMKIMNTWNGNPAAGSIVGFGEIAFGGNAVPEPSTFAILGSALIGLLAFAWRKRK